jgi:hypothetical protein
MVRTAGLLAHRLLELHASAILDIYELPMHQKHEFVREFLNAMIAAPKNLWHPVVVIVDEAHLFAPEKGQGESVASEAMADLASRGRKRGYCAVLATQRLAKLQKNVAAECQNVLVGRTTQVDQARAADVLNITGKASRDEFARTVGRMPTGTFFAYGMAFHQPEPTQFAVARPLTMPEAGSKRLIVPPPPSAIQAMLPKLADLPAEAEAKAKTVDDLKKEIVELNRKLKVTPSIAPEREQMLLERINALDGQVSSLKVTASAYEKAMSGIYAQAIVMAGAAKRIQETVDEVRGKATEIPPIPPMSMKIERITPIQALPRIQPTAVSGGKVRAGAERMLAVCAQWFPKGRTEAQVASQVQMKRTGGTWAAYKSDLKQNGYLDIRDGIWYATEAGVSYFGGSIPDAPRTTEEVFNLWTPKLRAGAVKMLEELIRHKGSQITREQLGHAVEMEPRGGTFSAYLSDLKTADLILVAGSNLSANAETLFL